MDPATEAAAPSFHWVVTAEGMIRVRLPHPQVESATGRFNEKAVFLIAASQTARDGSGRATTAKESIARRERERERESEREQERGETS